MRRIAVGEKKVFSVKLDPLDLELLEHVSRKKKVSKGEIIRRALKLFFTIDNGKPYITRRVRVYDA